MTWLIDYKWQIPLELHGKNQSMSQFWTLNGTVVNRSGVCSCRLLLMAFLAEAENWRWSTGCATEVFRGGRWNFRCYFELLRVSLKLHCDFIRTIWSRQPKQFFLEVNCTKPAEQGGGEETSSNLRYEFHSDNVMSTGMSSSGCHWYC